MIGKRRRVESRSYVEKHYRMIVFLLFFADVADPLGLSIVMQYSALFEGRSFFLSDFLELFYNAFSEFRDLRNPDEIIIELKSIGKSRDEFRDRYEALRRRTERNHKNTDKELQDKLTRMERENQELKIKILEYESTVSTQPAKAVIWTLF